MNLTELQRVAFMCFGGKQFAALVVGSQHGVDEGYGAGRGFLRPRTHAPGLAVFDMAGFAIALAENEAKECGLADAVATDEAHLAAVGNGGAGSL